MQEISFDQGYAMVGQKKLPFEKRSIQDKFSIYVPSDFLEDKNLVSNYTYLFSGDKSPLSIAIKHTPVRNLEDRQKLINHYFSQAGETRGNATVQLEPGILYRETVTSGRFLSIYSLRFSIEVEDGVLFGCFNSSADFQDDWRPVILESLRNIHVWEE